MIDKDSRSMSNHNIQPTPSIASGVALITQQLATTPSMYPGQDTVVGTLLLSPIKEMEPGSVNNTLHPGHPATSALAKSILPAALQSSGFSAVNLTTNGISVATTPLATAISMVLPQQTESSNVIITDLPSDNNLDVDHKQHDIISRKSSNVTSISGNNKFINKYIIG